MPPEKFGLEVNKSAPSSLPRRDGCLHQDEGAAVQRENVINPPVTASISG